MKTAAALLVLTLCAPAWAHSEKPAPEGGAAPAATAAAPQAGTRDARAYFTDLELVTQDNRKVHFYSDTMEGRTVVINFIYTNCKDACPLILQKMLQVRDLLGDQFGRDIVFITLTTDPDRDTPAAMKAYAAKQSADIPGWTYLSGKKENVTHILKKLGSYSSNVEDHSTLLLAGNVPLKRWQKIRPDAAPQVIADRLQVLAAGKSE